jgi:hypothetical protein
MSAERSVSLCAPRFERPREVLQFSILAAHYFRKPNVGHSVPISAGNVATGIGEALAAVELDELREDLREDGTRAAVLTDDIDRLDRSERGTCGAPDKVVCLRGSTPQLSERLIRVLLHLPYPRQRQRRTLLGYLHLVLLAAGWKSVQGDRILRYPAL